MKPSFFPVTLIALLTLGLTACHDDIIRDTSPPSATGEAGAVTIRLSVPHGIDETRGNDFHTYDPQRTSSALGGLSNCELQQTYALRYQLEVWDTTMTHRIIDRLVVVDNYEDVVSYNINLYPGHIYRVVCWADFILYRSDHEYHLEEPWLDDLFYNTRDLKDITVKDTRPNRYLNLEGRDAYFKTMKLPVGNTSQTINMVLRRPFAKVRIVTTDWAKNGLATPDSLEIRYKNCRRFTAFNALTGESEVEDVDSNTVYTATLAPVNRYHQSYDGLSQANRTIMVDYLMTDVDSVQTPIHFNLKAIKKGQDKPLTDRDFVTDIPIRRNYLTTLLGNALTSTVDMRVLCTEAFVHEKIILFGTDDYNKVDTMRPQRHPVGEDGITTESWNITNINEWKWLGTEAYRQNPDGVYDIALTNDLDFRNIRNYDPLEIPFAGVTLYGRYHKISNLSMNEVHVTGNGPNEVIPYMAVLYAGEGINIKNLTFENVTLLIPEHLDPDLKPSVKYMEAAPLAGLRRGKLTNVEALNTHIEAPRQNPYVQNNFRSWVIAGLASRVDDCTMTNCRADNVNLYAYKFAGGLLGYTSACTINDCRVDNIYIHTTRPVKTNWVNEGVLQTGALHPFIACRANNLPIGERNTIAHSYIYRPDGSENRIVYYPNGQPNPEYYCYEPANEYWGWIVSTADTPKPE